MTSLYLVLFNLLYVSNIHLFTLKHHSKITGKTNAPKRKRKMHVFNKSSSLLNYSEKNINPIAPGPVWVEIIGVVYDISI